MKVEKGKEGILLESGTNEIEIMKFTIQGEFYGINVAKVKEIMMAFTFSAIMISFTFATLIP